MAKKKLTHQAHAPKQQNPSLKDQTDNPLSRHPSMEEEDPAAAAEKMQSLKSLNSMLLKETFERRQQAESLEQAKAELESRLTRSDSQKMHLASELTLECDKNLRLELERLLQCAYLETRMKEVGVGSVNLMKKRDDQESEIRSLKKEVDVLKNGLESERDKVSRAYRERDSAESNLLSQVEEATRLKERVIEMEETERKFEEEIGKLKKEQECLKNEKVSLEKGMNDARKEKELLAKELDAMVKNSESLNFKLEKVVSEKKEMERQMVEQLAEIAELKKEQEELDELVSRFRKEEKLLQGKVLELEKSCAEANERAAEVVALVREKKETEGYIQSLMEEKETVSRKFEMARSDLEASQRTVGRLLEETGAFKRNIDENGKEMKAKEQRIQELCRERDETERLRATLESASVELQAEVRKQQDEVSRLQESYSIQEHRSKELISEADRLKVALNQATLDRDDALKVLEEERKNGLTLMGNVSEMTKKIEETSEQLKEARNALTKLMEEKKGTESVIGSLREDKEKLQKELMEANEATADLKAKMEAASGNAGQAFTLLKKTASLLCDLESRNGSKNMVEEKRGDEIEAYAAELEAIKKAFRNKETSIDEMKLEMKTMETSMAQVQKKKNFWTLFSSFTAFFAAASFAYVTRVR